MFVDSSGWIAFFSRRDANHGEAVRKMTAAAAAGIPLVTTNLVVAETHRLLLFRAGIAAAAAVLDALDRTSKLRIHHAGEADHASARAWIGQMDDQKISYADAVSFSVMTGLSCRGFLGFDRDFDAAGWNRWQP